jgi:hypothetical protein
MKVRVTVTLDVDPEMWTLNYGVEGRAAIAADEREWARTLLHEAASESGNLKENW